MSELILKCPECGKKNRITEPGKTNRCGNCGHGLETKGTPVEVTDDGFDSLLKSESRMVVDFWAGWCGPCVRMAPIFAEVASRTPDVRFAKLDTEANPETSMKFNVRSIPTMIFFKDGKETGRLVGLSDGAALESAISRYL